MWGASGIAWLRTGDGSMAGIDDLFSAAQQAVQAINALNQTLSTAFPNWVGVPASATANGTPGQVAYDATHFYVCVADNTWVRATLATF